MSDTDLPFDPSHLVLDYSMEQDVDDRPHHVLQRWEVRVFYRPDPEGEWGREVDVAHLSFFRLRFGADPGVLDEIDGETNSYSQLYDDERYLGDTLGIGGLLIAYRATVEPEYRGHEIGPMAMALAIEALRDGCGAVCCTPAPIEGGPEHDDPAWAAWHKSEAARLAKVWGKVGFRRWKRSEVYVINLDDKTLDEALERWV